MSRTNKQHVCCVGIDNAFALQSLFALSAWVGFHAHVGCISRLSASQKPIAMRFGLGTGRQLTLHALVIELFVVVLGPQLTLHKP